VNDIGKLKDAMLKTLTLIAMVHDKASVHDISRVLDEIEKILTKIDD